MLSRPLQNLIPKYLFHEEIHTGVSSEIYRVYDPSGNEYALKLFNRHINTEQFKEELDNCKLLCHIENPDFIRYITSSVDEGISNVKYIVFEFAEKRSLDNFISLEIPFGEKMTKFVFFKIAKMAERLHMLNFSHRDLNFHNILLDQNYNLKLGDFGSTKYFLNQNGKSALLFGKGGTPNYMAPEMNKKLYDGKKVDIFSLGVLLLYMRTRKQIFEIYKEKVLNFIKKKQFEKFWFFIEKGDQELNLTPEFKDLINSMIEYNPKNRIDISDVLNHPWLEDIRSLKAEDFLAYEKSVKKKFKEIEESLKHF